MNRRDHIVRMTLVIGVLALVMIGGRKPPPTDRTSQLSFGVEMAKRGLWSEALFRFKQADRQAPGDPRILNNLAVAYEALGNFEKALDYYQEAITADPSNRELKRNYSRFVEFYRAFKPAEPPVSAPPARQAAATSPSGS